MRRVHRANAPVIAALLAVALPAAALVIAPSAMAWKAGGHLVEAERVAQALPDGSAIKKAMVAYPSAAAWGSYGADLGYGDVEFIDIARGYTQWADRLHYQRAGTLAKLLLQRALASGDQEQIAFAAGYLTHTTGDLACHSIYVNPEAGGVYFADEASHDLHGDLERWAEPYIWKDWGGHDPADYVAGLYPGTFLAAYSPTPSGSTDYLFAQAMQDVYGISPLAGGVGRWISACYGIMYNPVTAGVGGLFCGYDESAAALNAPQPNGSSRRAKLDAAMERSISHAVDLLQQAEAGDYTRFVDTWNLDVGERPSDEFGELTVRIHTGSDDDYDFPGTDDTVWFSMFLGNGEKWYGPALDIGGDFYSDFEQDDDDWYFIYVPGRYTRPDNVKRIELWKAPDGVSGGWRPDHISVWVNGRQVVDEGIGKWLEDDDRGWDKFVDWSGVVDMTPPVTSATTAGTEGLDGWFRSAVTLTLGVTDNSSSSDECVTEYSLDGTTWTPYRGPFLVTRQGSSSVWYRSRDALGNEEAAKRLDLKIDSEPPAIRITSPVQSAFFTLGQVVYARWAVSDVTSGVGGMFWTVDDGAQLDTRSVTKADPATWRSVLVQAVDAAGNQASAMATYRVGYAHGIDFAGPIDANGMSCFKLGSTVPVKFRLADAAGMAAATCAATIEMRFLDGTPDGTDVEAVSTAAATTGTAFRYDAAASQYIFNLSTKGLRKGDYEITARLDDGTTISEHISLK